jgi:hypothetical protein
VRTRITVLVRPFQLIIAGYGIDVLVGCSLTADAWKCVGEEQEQEQEQEQRFGYGPASFGAVRFFEARVAMEAMTCDKWLRGSDAATTRLQARVARSNDYPTVAVT